MRCAKLWHGVWSSVCTSRASHGKQGTPAVCPSKSPKGECLANFKSRSLGPNAAEYTQRLAGREKEEVEVTELLRDWRPDVGLGRGVLTLPPSISSSAS